MGKRLDDATQRIKKLIDSEIMGDTSVAQAATRSALEDIVEYVQESIAALDPDEDDES